jgi:hypothetical protein
VPIIADVIEPKGAVVVEYDDRGRRAVLEFVSGERRAITPPEKVEVVTGMKVRVIDTGGGAEMLVWDA